jgi:hypothetical protein
LGQLGNYQFFNNDPIPWSFTFKIALQTWFFEKFLNIVYDYGVTNRVQIQNIYTLPLQGRKSMTSEQDSPADKKTVCDLRTLF